MEVEAEALETREVPTTSRTHRPIYKTTREAVTPDRRRWIIEYELCCERTGTGREFLYIKGYERCYKQDRLLSEDLGLSPVLDASPQQAIEVYASICQTDTPVSAMHIADIARDLLLTAEDCSDRATEGFENMTMVQSLSV